MAMMCKSHDESKYGNDVRSHDESKYGNGV